MNPSVLGPGRIAPKRWSRSAPALLLLVFTQEPPPPITEIEIVPASVMVHHDQGTTTFELEARLWTGDAGARRSITESQVPDPLNWNPSPTWLKRLSQSGFRATFSIEQELQGTQTATVTVEAGGKTSPATTVVVVNDPGANDDFLTAAYSADKVPDAVVVNGVRDTPGGPCSVTLSPFVAGSTLGNLVELCAGDDSRWRVAVLSVDHRLAFESGQWTQQQDLVDADGMQKAPLVIPLALRVMVADDTRSPEELKELRQSIMDIARAEVEAANGVLAATRSGIQLGEPDTATIDTLDPTEVNADGLVEVIDCLPGDDLTSKYDATGKLNVYYVNGLAGYRGWTCPWHLWRKYPVIYMEVHDELQTTLVHEVGHALGLTLPYDGHTEIVGGLDVSNVMTSGYSPEDAGGRRRLTVGQVFRMNADSASWLNWATEGNALVRETAAPRLACQCGEKDPAGRCPQVAEDVARRSVGEDRTYSWDCFDKLLIKYAPLTERPVAIVAGRRWRAPPDACSPELPGWEANHWEGIYVALENLTRPGDCDAWALVFFERHGVRFVDLSEPSVILTQVADELVIDGSMTKPHPVRVRLYHSTVDPTVVKKDVFYALTVFGPLNRTGISLLFDLRPTFCPLFGPSPGELQVCYVTGMTKEGTLVGPRSVRIGKRTGTTLAHFIGRALGLDALNPPLPDLPGNIMQPPLAQRGKSLTLGQVFRINVALGVLSGCNPTPCPSLTMDVRP